MYKNFVVSGSFAAYNLVDVMMLLSATYGDWY